MICPVVPPVFKAVCHFAGILYVLSLGLKVPTAEDSARWSAAVPQERAGGGEVEQARQERRVAVHFFLNAG